MGFRNGKRLKDYLVRAALEKVDNARGSKPCGKGTCQLCDYIIRSNNFKIKASEEVFMKNGAIIVNRKNFFTFWDAKNVMILPMLGRLKQSSVFGLPTKKQWSFRKRKQNVPQERFHSYYVQVCHKGIDWKVTLFEKCETHK